MSKLTLPIVLMFTLATAATACGSDDQQSAGSDALCSSFNWDAKASLTANEERMRALVEKSAGEGASLGSAVSRAENDCPEVVGDYVNAVRGDGSGTNAQASSDLEDPRLTAKLQDRGVDAGAVMRLGAVMDVLGIDSSSRDPMSIGEAQRVAVQTVHVCDAVAEGSTSWPEVARHRRELGDSSGQAENLTAYLRLHFCPQVS